MKKLNLFMILGMFIFLVSCDVQTVKAQDSAPGYRTDNEYISQFYAKSTGVDTIAVSLNQAVYFDGMQFTVKARRPNTSNQVYVKVNSLTPKKLWYSQKVSAATTNYQHNLVKVVSKDSLIAGQELINLIYDADSSRFILLRAQ